MSERELLEALGRQCGGHDHEEVIGAAANLALNAIRQSHPTLDAAEVSFDKLVVEMRAILRKDHYDQSGRRKDRRLIIPPLGALLRH